MKNNVCRCWLFFLIPLLIFQHARASKLTEVKVVDKDYLMIRFMDGEVTFVDDGLGDCAYLNCCHNESNDNIVSYAPSLNTSQATNAANWTITSDNDANYGTAGLHPIACYRKSKLNGMTEESWNTETNDWNYNYTMEHTIYLELPASIAPGNTYTLTIDANTNTDATSTTFTYNIFESCSEAIHVNLVGYSTAPGVKAVDLYMWMGNGDARDYSGFEGKKVFLYNVQTQQSQEVGTVTIWNGSATEAHWYNLIHSDVYNADFTGFDQEGTYRLAIEDVGCSQDFKISSTLYYEPFQVSVLGFFYMRIGQDSTGGISPVPRRPLWIPNESPPDTRVFITTMHPFHPEWESFGGNWDRSSGWADYMKEGNPENPDAWGGHSDALDWDRHLGHISIIYDMLLPFILTNGTIDDDHLGIAESGNGIPDILDEARNEVDFWLRLRDGKGYSHGLNNPTDEHIFYQAGINGMAAWANAANSAMLSNCFQIAGLHELAGEYRDSAFAAYNYASALPVSEQLLDTEHGIGDINIRGRELKMMAAAYLYNVTGDVSYEDLVYSESIATSDNAAILSGEVNQLWSTAAYLFTKQTVHYPELYNHMKASIIHDAKQSEANFSLSRPSRRSTDHNAGYFKTAQNVQRTIIAHAVADDPSDKELLLDALILEADWGLGRNPINMIQMTTASTSLGSKRSVVNLYSSGYDDGVPGMHPGHTPYLNTDDWYCDMVMGCPSWMTSKCYPDYSQWPDADDYFDTRYVWAHSEFTPQQTMRGKTALYGYLYGIGEPFIPSGKKNTKIQAASKLEIFPNPAASELNVRLPGEISEARLFIIDTNGRLVDTKKLTSNVSKIDTSVLVRGIYLVKVVSKQDFWVNKLIVQ